MKTHLQNVKDLALPLSLGVDAHVQCLIGQRNKTAEN